MWRLIVIVFSTTISCVCMIGHCQSPSGQTYNPARQNLVETYASPEIAEEFHALMEDYSRSSARLLAKKYKDMHFLSAAVFMQLSADGCDVISMSDDVLQSAEGIRAHSAVQLLSEYSHVMCSTGFGADGGPFLDREQTGRELAEHISVLAGSNLAKANRIAREALSTGEYPSCHVVAEWANTQFLLWFLRPAVAPSWLDLELAVRLLIELRSRGFLPHEYLTQIDMLTFMSDAFFARGHRLLGIGCARLALLLYPDDKERAMGVVMPEVKPEELRRRIHELCAERNRCQALEP